MFDIDDILALYERGVLCAPVRRGSKFPDYGAMRLVFDESMLGDKSLSRLAGNSVAFWLSQRPPDREELRRWFYGHEGNVGIVAGFNGLAVLDIDNASYYDRIVHEVSRLSKEFPIERTPHGFHVYLKCRQPHSCSSLYLAGRRIGHFSALGGFVTCSPSILADGSRYSWMPGRSLLDCDPVEITDLKQLNLSPMHPLRRLYKSVKSSFR